MLLQMEIIYNLSYDVKFQTLVLKSGPFALELANFGPPVNEIYSLSNLHHKTSFKSQSLGEK